MSNYLEIVWVVGLILAGVIAFGALFWFSVGEIEDGTWWSRLLVFVGWTLLISVAIYFGTRPGSPQ